MLLTLAGGCAQRPATVVDAFPPARVATPWVLAGEVWSGTLAEAGPGLGEDAARWRGLGVEHVWLARYEHEDNPQRILTVRCLALPTPAAARRLFDELRPREDAWPFHGGDAGCWTGIGVLVQWGRLVIDVFGSEQSWSSEVQAALLAGHLLKRMPAGVPDEPR